MASVSVAPERGSSSPSGPPATASFHRFRRIDQLIQAERKGQPGMRGAMTSTLRQPQTGEVGGIEPGAAVAVSSLRGHRASSAAANERLLGYRALEDNIDAPSSRQLIPAETKRSAPVQTLQALPNEPQRDASVQTSPEGGPSSKSRRARATTEPGGIQSGRVRFRHSDMSLAADEKGKSLPAPPCGSEFAQASSSLRQTFATSDPRVPSAKLSAPPFSSTEEKLFANLDTVGLAPFRIQLGRQQDVVVELFAPTPKQGSIGGLLVIDLRAAGTRGRGEVYVFEPRGRNVSVYVPPPTAQPLPALLHALAPQRVYLSSDLSRLLELETSGALVQEDRRCVRMTRMVGEVVQAVRARTPLLSCEELRYTMPAWPGHEPSRARHLDLYAPLRSRITVFSDSLQPTYTVSISPLNPIDDATAALNISLEVHVSPARDQCRFRFSSRQSNASTAESAANRLDELHLPLSQTRSRAPDDELSAIEQWFDARCDAMSQASDVLPPALRSSLIDLARYWISLAAQAQIHSISAAHIAARNQLDRTENQARSQSLAIKSHAPTASPSLERRLSRLLTSAAGFENCDTIPRSRPPAGAGSRSPRPPDRRCLPGLGWILRSADPDGTHICYTVLFIDGRELHVLTARGATTPATTFLLDAKGRRCPLSRPEDLPNGLSKRLPFLAEMLLLFED